MNFKLYLKESFNIKAIIVYILNAIIALVFGIVAFFVEKKVSNLIKKARVDAISIPGIYLILVYVLILIYQSGFFNPLRSKKKENKIQIAKARYNQKIALAVKPEEKEELKKKQALEIELIEKKYENKYVTKANFLTYLSIFIGLILITVSLIVWFI
ncbi:MAG: DUF3899 domain-containing protein [Metamycoplasmataceae bacterium]